ncbi:hypothetical protein [Pseudomonas quasicaspiana]|nr:hypothetical protein [Pseudomonas quasicaspiana]
MRQQLIDFTRPLRRQAREHVRKRLPNTPCVVKRASIYVTAAL